MMTELLIAAQMRALEQAAIASGAVTGLELMERAGRGVVEAILNEWTEFREGERRAVVLCGPGNNGGDGFVVARLLREAGWAVEVFLYGDAEKLPPDARVNYERWVAIGKVVVRRIDPPPLVDDSLYIPIAPAVVVDALFGVGLTRPFRGIFAALAESDVQDLMRKKGTRRVAVDVPTGLSADLGSVIGLNVLTADLTVTFHRPKACHLLEEAKAYCGHSVVKDIGLQPWDPELKDAL